MRQRTGRFALSGFLHRCFRNLATPVRLKTRLDDPTGLAAEQLRMLHDVQESALTYQAIEIADREAAGFGITRDDKKHKRGLGELNPFRDSRVLSHIE